MWDWIELLFCGRRLRALQARLTEVERERGHLLRACRAYLDPDRWEIGGRPYRELSNQIRAAVETATEGDNRRNARRP